MAHKQLATYLNNHLAAATTVLELQGVNYATLVQHSEEQQQRVETWRLQAAKAALV